MAELKSVELYLKLIEKIDQYEAKLLEKYSSDIACRRGCDSCCILESVFPVEAYIICEAVRSGEVEPECTFNNGGKCVFLKNGGCSIYKVRPVICRTHGYPVFVEGRVDFCPENFKGRSSIDSEYILNLENLNMTLVSINRIFADENNNDFFKRERIPLKEVAECIINKMKPD
ncbi:MAG TPA: YkgJ family cysteine cluster protein [Spirochaetota bacterium]|nr:YkgJ family cysteine cluster protein [Spirochaetota bacterium]HPJ34272.1 YkgJ family cysteine cluster protein [Spirochaetota bacterium]